MSLLSAFFSSASLAGAAERQAPKRGPAAAPSARQDRLERSIPRVPPPAYAPPLRRQRRPMAVRPAGPPG